MSGPEDFVSFDDYLGLNQGAGEAMSNQLMSEGDKLRDEARAATDARFAAAKGGSDAYAASGQRETKALTSYGDFMQKMKDPAARQAAMAKVFGSANRFDAALTGAAGAGRMAQGDADLRGAQDYSKNAAARDVGRAAEYDRMAGLYAQQEKEYEAALKAKRDAQTAGRAKRVTDDENSRIDSYARAEGYWRGNYRPDQSVGGGGFFDSTKDPFDKSGQQTARQQAAKELELKESTYGTRWESNPGGGGRWVKRTKPYGDVRDIYNPKLSG